MYVCVLCGCGIERVDLWDYEKAVYPVGFPEQDKQRVHSTCLNAAIDVELGKLLADSYMSGAGMRGLGACDVCGAEDVQIFRTEYGWLCARCWVAAGEGDSAG